MNRKATTIWFFAWLMMLIALILSENEASNLQRVITSHESTIKAQRLEIQYLYDAICKYESGEKYQEELALRMALYDEMADLRDRLNYVLDNTYGHHLPDLPFEYENAVIIDKITKDGE